MLKLEKVDLLRGGRRVLRDVNLEIHSRNKVGVTGRNGAGKSSLLQLIAGDLHADSGTVSIPKGLRIARVAQDFQVTDRVAIEYVLDGDGELRRLQSELEAAEQAGDGHRQALVHGKLDDVDAYSAPARAAQIMRGLGFQRSDEGAPLASFSGGWRMRLHLAQALMWRSDLLLLDEPTNHLDLDAVIWLEGWLRGYEGILLLISHDREFMDPLVDHIAHVVPDLYAVAKLEGAPPENESPSGKVHNEVLESDGQSSRYQAEECAKGLNRVRPNAYDQYHAEAKCDVAS